MKTTLILSAMTILLCGTAGTYAVDKAPPCATPDAPPEQLMPPPDAPPPPPPPPPPGAHDFRPGRLRRGPHGMPLLPHLRVWLQQKNPAELARLEQLRKENPDAFRNEMRKCLRSFAEEMHPEMKAHFDQQRAAWHALRGLAEQYRASTNDTERTALQQQLREKLVQMFEARQEVRKKELAQLAKRIEKLNKAVHNREQNKDALIEEQLKVITEGRRPVEW